MSSPRLFWKNKKCAAPNEATHEKRIAPIAATQFFNIQTGNAKVENAFLPKGKNHSLLGFHNRIVSQEYFTTPPHKLQLQIP